MLEDHYGDVTLLRFERLAREEGLAHAVTAGPQNYAPHRGRGADQAVAHRRRVCELLGVDFEKLTSPAQVHGAELLALEEGDIGKGRDGRGSAVPFVDGLICDSPGVPIILLSGDCPLICAFDPARKVMGAVHASWQGTVAGAAGQLIRQMARRFGCDPAGLLVGIAPSAGPCCYEVGPEVRRIALGRYDDAESWFRPRRDRFILDLWSANKGQLLAAGVELANIETAGLCTICDRRFWSHRRDGSEAGRFALFLAIR